jgi:hypothetical protein
MRWRQSLPDDHDRRAEKPPNRAFPCPPNCPQRPVQDPGWKTPAGVFLPVPLCEGRAHAGSIRSYSHSSESENENAYYCACRRCGPLAHRSDSRKRRACVDRAGYPGGSDRCLGKESPSPRTKAPRTKAPCPARSRRAPRLFPLPSPGLCETLISAGFASVADQGPLPYQHRVLLCFQS